MRSVALQVCHVLMVVSYCVPGSAQSLNGDQPNPGAPGS